ncbi:MAG: hypothetical protein U0354_09710 [Candidatus Sericytochromatia bacterium]
MSKIKYVGHPFVDVGVSVMEILLEKTCEEFTDEDIEKAKQELIKEYDNNTLKGYLSTIFPNSAWANFNIGKEKKEENINNLLYSKNELNKKCFYCENKANRYSNRQDIPLLTGESVINVVSTGLGLPVCTDCLTSIQFFPLGTIKVEGSALLWNTHDIDLSYILTRNHFDKLKLLIDGAVDNKVESLKFPFTRIFEALENALKIIKDNNPNKYPITDCIAYHFTNYGTSPNYKEYIIPSSFLSFKKKLDTNNELNAIYKQIINNSWFSKNKKETEQKNKENRFYTDLGKFLQQDTFKEVNHRLLKHFIHTKKKELNSFSLVSLFLIEVTGMNKVRLEKIKDLADKIVKLNSEKHIKELFRKKYSQRDFIDYLVRIQAKLKSSNLPVFSMDEICIALGISNSDDTTNNDFYLVRDLILIRLLELTSIHLEDDEIAQDLEE